MTTQTLKKWQQIKLGDCLEKVIGGGTPSKYNNSYWNGSIPWASVKDLKEGQYRITETEDFITEEGLKNSASNLVKKDTIIISTRMGLGRAAKAGKDLAINQDLKAIIPNDKIDNDFLLWLYLNKGHEIQQLGTGATVAGVRIEDVRNLDISIPDLATQKQIAEFLSTYDDLIENNTRRIQILEQMAQAVYMEWFGSADSDSWKISSLGEQLSELESGSRPKGGIIEVENGIPSVGAENVNGIGKHNYSSEKFISKSFFEKMKRGKVRDRDVAIYKDGAYIGRSSYFRDSFPHKTFAVNEHVFLLRTTGENITQNFLYMWLRQQETIHSIRATNANAAQPGVNQPGIRGLKIFLPPQKEVQEFDCLVEPVFATITNLAKQNNNLRQTRDLLLPKLVSGEIKI